jgi:hypothetical protein
MLTIALATAKVLRTPPPMYHRVRQVDALRHASLTPPLRIVQRIQILITSK